MDKVRRHGWLLPVLVAAGYLALMFWKAPLSGRFIFGGDEGYELMKGFLCDRGHELYREIWNDQPPLHTALLAAWFGLVGPTALAGRVLAVLFSALLIAVLCELVRRGSGMLGALTAGSVLMAWPGWLHLSASVMLEIPAMTLGLGALLLAWSYHRQPGGLALVASGVVMGLALQTKLTSALFIPTALWLLWCGVLGRAELREGRATRRLFTATAVWSAAVAATVLAVFLAFPGQTVEMLLLPHFPRGTEGWPGADRGLDFGRYFSNNWDLLPPALVGAAYLIWRREAAALTPVVLLATVAVVHWVHRPYWDYYTVHFAIPAAWLSGVALQQSLEAVLELPRERLVRPPFPALWAALGWSLVASLLLSSLPERWSREFAAVTLPGRSVEEDAMVRNLRRHGAGTRWLFTDDPMTAFHAGLPIPPELAVIPSKRVWSGQISVDYVREQLERFAPEQIYLPGQRWSVSESSELEAFFQQDYELQTDGGGRWFVRKR